MERDYSKSIDRDAEGIKSNTDYSELERQRRISAKKASKDKARLEEEELIRRARIAAAKIEKNYRAESAKKGKTERDYDTLWIDEETEPDTEIFTEGNDDSWMAPEENLSADETASEEEDELKWIEVNFDSQVPSDEEAAEQETAPEEPAEQETAPEEPAEQETAPEEPAEQKPTQEEPAEQKPVEHAFVEQEGAGQSNSYADPDEEYIRDVMTAVEEAESPERLPSEQLNEPEESEKTAQEDTAENNERVVSRPASGSYQKKARGQHSVKKAPKTRKKRTVKPASTGDLVLQILLGLILSILISAGITYLALLLGPEPSEGIGPFEQGFPLLFLNFLPIFLTMIVLDFAFWNVFYAGAATSFIWLLLSLANTLKIQARDEPVALSDILLLKEALNVSQHYSLNVPVLMVFIIANLIIILIFLGYFLRPKKRAAKLPAIRLIGTLVAIAVMVGVIKYPLASQERYDSFSIENEFYVTGIYNQLGFPYSFAYNLTKNNAVKPDGYSASVAKEYEEDPAFGQGKDVNVIFVMNESFTDLSDYDVFDYPEDEDPLENFHALAESENAFSGHLVVHWLGGGTANTEYDVTTGMQTEMLSSSSASAFRYVKHNIDSIFRVFDGDGYRTLFMHPGDPWFYNRENVYPRLGAQESLFTEDLNGLIYKGDWVTDDSLADNIFEQFENSMAKGENLFAYVSTIQNHMSYDYSKYGEDYNFHKVYCSKEISFENRAYLPVYFEGVYDADASLKKMTDYFSEREEPVVLVFFGDHFPALGADREVYKELGLAIGDESGQTGDDPLCAYEPPYLVWCNDAAAEELNFEKAVKKLNLPEDGMISASYLGAMILELTGRNDEDAYFSYVNELRRELPVITNDLYKDSSGEYITELDSEQEYMVKKLRWWSYYRLTDAQVSNETVPQTS